MGNRRDEYADRVTGLDDAPHGESTVRGDVWAVSAYGIRLAGAAPGSRDGWYNWSKYAEKSASVPENGDTVELVLDSRGFLRGWRMIAPFHKSQAAATNGNGKATPVQQSAGGDAQPPATPSDAPSAAEQVIAEGHAPDRETLIGRYAVLNTATAILSSGNRPTSAEDVIALAERLERWAHRPVA